MTTVASPAAAGAHAWPNVTHRIGEVSGVVGLFGGARLIGDHPLGENFMWYPAGGLPNGSELIDIQATVHPWFLHDGVTPHPQAGEPDGAGIVAHYDVGGGHRRPFVAKWQRPG